MRHPTLYLHRESGLHGLHPLTKLTATVFLLASAAALPKAWQILAAFGLILLPLALWGRVFAIFVKSIAKLIWPFALSLFLIQGFFTPGESIWLKIGPLTFTGEGVRLAVKFASRLLIWLGAAELLMITTRPDLLMLSLTNLGLPRQVGYIVLTTLQIIPRFLARAETILDAQRSRGLETGASLHTRVKALVPLISPLIISSIAELDQRAISLEARGFKRRGSKTSFRKLRDTRVQVLIRIVILASIPGVIAFGLYLRSLP